MTLNFPELETKILKFWKEKKIFEKLREKNKGKERWSFLDGPITANNPMGVHHAWGRTYKDLFQRYKALQGFDQRYQNGFDCQGLWVEVEVEKELGFKSKKDIEKYGIEKFVNACKARVKKYSKIQTEQSIRLGQWMDWKNSYYTMSDENNYAIWHFLKKCHQKGLLYKGRDSVPWCPRCGTAISQHEILTEEYKELVHKSIFFKLPIGNHKNTYFLVWTTTPWTLPGNVALAVHSDFDYVKVKDEKGDVFILLKEKADLIENGQIMETVKGKKLEGLKYEGLFDELPVVKEVLGNYRHSVILWDEITQEEGTGIVHIAPGCGQEDFQLSKDSKLPVIDLTDNESNYRKGFGNLSGKFVGGEEVRELIFENLKQKDRVFKIEDYKHRYPTCWRCKSELIFRVVDEWYISMDELKKPLREVVKKIKWIPGFGLERELDWIKNMRDWLISKKRYWGLALPIYECQKCGNFEVIGSKKELKERAVSGWDKFEGHSPHRPWVDEAKIKCSKCGKEITRIPDVGNPWLDAGIVPFSTMGYFTDKEYWKKWFPADLICESFPGQFRNWFYAVITMSTVLEEVPPVKTIFGYALVRDEKGEEMHKSKENVIWFDEAVDKIGADPMRWMYARHNPAYNLRFGYAPAEEIKRKLLILYNIFTFFNTYVDKKELQNRDLKIEPENVLDRWIISRFNNLIKEVDKNLEGYNTAVATLAIEKFFIDDLSLWYVRRSRKRFHSGHPERKKAVQTFYYVLLNLTKIIAPIIPFFAEEMYSGLLLKGMPGSIHLNDWPQPDEAMIDKEKEDEMAKIRNIVTLALAERAAAGIKVRQPLSKLKIKRQLKIKEKELLDLIKEEVNVKDIVFDAKIKKEVELDTKITKELEKEGEYREALRNTRDLRKRLDLSPEIIVASINSTASDVVDENFLREVGARKFIKVEKESEMDVDIKKEIKLRDEKHYIGIKK